MELFTLTWPDAFAVVASVITVVGGLLAFYSSYSKNHTNSNGDTTKSQLPPLENIQLHERISGLKDRVATLDGEQKVLATQIENLTKQINDHDVRDVEDFKTINAKVDKLMEIIVEMLKDDH